MAVGNKVRVFNYLFKILSEDRNNLLPYTFAQKPDFKALASPDYLPISTPTLEGLTNQQIQDFFNELNQNKGVNLHATMVVKNGKTIVKATYSPYEADIWNTTHSLCKTITAFAVGLAIKEGYFGLDDNVHELLVGKPSLFTATGFRQLTVKHLLMMTSGVNFRETSIVSTANWTDGFLRADFNFLPGTDFQYNSMNTYILAKIISLKTGMGLMEFLTPRLFEPLKIKNVTWEKSPEGVEKAGWGMYLTLEAMAKIGQLVLQLGTWEVDGVDKQIIPQSWLRDMFYPHTLTTKHRENYGYQVWLGKHAKYYCFSGLFGQMIYINPQYNLVVAFTSGNNNVFNSTDMIAAIENHLFDKIEFKEGKQDISKASLTDFLKTLRYRDYHLMVKNEINPMQPTNTESFFEKVKHFFGNKKEMMVVADELPDALQAVNNRKYNFTANQVGVLPVIIQMMNGNYAKGIEQVKFELQHDRVILHWQEKGNHLIIPVGLYEPIKTTLKIGTESFIVSSFTTLATDEDDNFVLKMNICFLETSSVREIKCFFLDETNEVLLKFAENPSVAYLTRNVLAQISSSESNSFFGKDNGYVKFMLERLTLPCIKGTLDQ